MASGGGRTWRRFKNGPNGHWLCYCFCFTWSTCRRVSREYEVQIFTCCCTFVFYLLLVWRISLHWKLMCLFVSVFDVERTRDETKISMCVTFLYSIIWYTVLFPLKYISFFQGDGRHHKGTSRLDIPIRENIYGGMTKAQLSEAQGKELQLAQQDRAMEQTKDKKNALESYVYDMRNKVQLVYIPIMFASLL